MNSNSLLHSSLTTGNWKTQNTGTEMESLKRLSNCYTHTPKTFRTTQALSVFVSNSDFHKLKELSDVEAGLLDFSMVCVC